jgi:uncharacterized protein YjbJ (UPF0337 family)
MKLHSHLTLRSSPFAPLQNHRTSATPSYTDVRSEPALSRPLEQGLNAPDLGFVRLCLSGLHLPEEREEALVQRDLLGPRFVPVIELFAHTEEASASFLSSRAGTTLLSTKRRVMSDGMQDKVEGTLKEKEGELTDDTMREKQGEAQQKVGEAKDKADDLKDEVSDRT